MKDKIKYIVFHIVIITDKKTEILCQKFKSGKEMFKFFDDFKKELSK